MTSSPPAEPRDLRALHAALAATFAVTSLLATCASDNADTAIDTNAAFDTIAIVPSDAGPDRPRTLPIPALADVTRITYGWSAFDANINRQDIVVDLRSWQLFLSTNGVALPSRPLELAEQQQVTAFLDTPTTLAALTEPEACGHDVLDYGEYVMVDVGASQGPRKVITLCEQPPFVTLRTLWQRLRDQHFCTGIGCSLPDAGADGGGNDAGAGD
jgi:hypothetical protein